MVFFQKIVILKELHLENIMQINKYEIAANETKFIIFRTRDITVGSIFVYVNYIKRGFFWQTNLLLDVTWFNPQNIWSFYLNKKSSFQNKYLPKNNKSNFDSQQKSYDRYQDQSKRKRSRVYGKTSLIKDKVQSSKQRSSFSVEKVEGNKMFY